MQIPLLKIKNEYQKIMQRTIDDKAVRTTSGMLDLAIKLYEEVSVEGISKNDDAENDILLFQCGILNKGKELDERFFLDITRQFIEPNEGELYQLSFMLLFKPDAFVDIKRNNCWSTDFGDLEKFASHIKTTKEYEIAEKTNFDSYKLQFEQC